MDSEPTVSRRQTRLSLFDKHDLTPDHGRRRRIWLNLCLSTKIVIFLLMWLFFVVTFFMPGPIQQDRVVALDMQSTTYINVYGKLKTNKIKVVLSGNFDKEMTNYPRLAKGSQNFLSIRVRIYNEKLNRTEWSSDEWSVYLIKSAPSRSHIVNVQNFFKMKPNYARSPDIATISSDDNYKIQIVLVNPVDDIFALKVKINTNPSELQYRVIAAGILLCVLYAVLILDITDPTFAAILLASCAIGVLCLLDERPTLETILTWIDIHTLVLLFGMMIMAAIMSETGIFGYLSVLAYRLSKGRAWILVTLLCLTSVVLSLFLELVTILIIMGPVVIRLCECMSLRTTTVLMCVVIFSNIGSALTPIGDPPNVLIITNFHVMEQGADFSTFVIHMFPGVVLSIFAAWVYIYLMFRNRLTDGAEEQTNNSLRQLAKRMGEGHVRRTMRLADEQSRQKKYSEAAVFRIMAASNYVETLAFMEANYKVHDKPLLIKSLISFLFAVILWTLHSLPTFSGAGISWTAVMASMLLLIFYDSKDLTAVLLRIDWSMLLFFTALFVLTEACSELGLITFLAEFTIKIIASVDPKYQVVTSIMLVMWLSFLFSLFIESIPIATMLLKLTIQVALSERINVPLLPMIWALCYGICFAGNGTLYATTANVATASVANKHGYKITFFEFFKFGFPVTIITISIASIYLIIAHGIFNWH